MINWWEETINEFFYAFDHNEKKEIYYFLRYSKLAHKINLVGGVRNCVLFDYGVNARTKAVIKDIPEEHRKMLLEKLEEPFFEIDLIRKVNEKLSEVQKQETFSSGYHFISNLQDAIDFLKVS